MNTRLDKFNPTLGLVRGRPWAFELVWYLFKCIFLLSSFPWPSALKVRVLRAFGAKVGKGTVIKPRVNIHLPWKLELGNYVWIGEEVFILNLEPVKIGSHVCISQRAFLCTGNHDYRKTDFSYRNAPITVGDGAWVGANVFVGPGVEIGPEAVLTAGSVANRDIAANTIAVGNPAIETGIRWPKN